jgi:hypothetical protein
LRIDAARRSGKIAATRPFPCKFLSIGAQAGTVVSPAPGAVTSGLAAGSLICALVGILFLPLGIVAVILGHKGLRQTRTNPGFKGEGMAMTGVIMGYFEVVLMVISVIAISVLIALGSQVRSTFKSINQQLQSAQGATNSDQPVTP